MSRVEHRITDGYRENSRESRQLQIKDFEEGRDKLT
jgi:hypothetical protein